MVVSQAPNRNETPAACVSEASSAESLVSHTSPSSVLVLDCSTSSATPVVASSHVGKQDDENDMAKDEADVAIESMLEEQTVPDMDILLDGSMTLAEIAQGIELDFELNSLFNGEDYGQQLEDFVIDDFEDIPIRGFEEDEPSGLPLPDFDLDFDFEACNEAFSWMDDTPAMMNGASPLNTINNIVCL